MKIVGVGPAPGYITEEAKEIIKNSNNIKGSERAIEIASKYIPKKSDIEVIEDYSSLSELTGDITVLSTGDPMLSGLGYLDGQVINGISSLQLACSEIGISMLEVVPISTHGRENKFDKIIQELLNGNKVFVLPDTSFKIELLADKAIENNLNLDIYVFSRLGYEDQNIKSGNIFDLPKPEFDLFSILLAPKN